MKTFCALCVSRCGATATVADGRLLSLEPDPDHPTGRALCAKGRAAPELITNADRLLTPLKRTGPKTGDPGWEPVTWDEALDLVATRMTDLARRHGPESVVFTNSSPSTSALSDSVVWIQRLQRAFGSPNYNLSMELCGWGRYLASQYTFGAGVPGSYMPDLERAGAILYWGYNPVTSRLAHTVDTNDALERGAKLVVVDPRRVGLAARADEWLRVRPGSDGALALGIAGEMLRHDWYDQEFVAAWTNGPLLVRSDTEELLRWSEVVTGDQPAADRSEFVTWDQTTDQPRPYRPAEGRYQGRVALTGRYEVATTEGPVECQPVLDRVRAMCDDLRPNRVEELTGVPAEQVTATARILWSNRPTAFYSWSGVEQQSGATQIARAIGLLHTLTGDFDAPGGNVLFGTPAQGNMVGNELLDAAQRSKTLGRDQRPSGPSRFGHVTSADIYQAILTGRPYPVRALVSFGSNLLMSHADAPTARQALNQLDFHVHADVFLNPTAELADIVLPVATPFETEGLKVGFEISERAASWVQLRAPLVEPAGQSRSDVDIVFDLACRLGLGEHFWHGDVEAAYRAQLEPSGVTIEQLRANPGGVAAPTEIGHRRYAESGRNGAPVGFRTPSAKIELWSEALAADGHDPLPVYQEPLVSPHSRPDMAERYPLVLTSAKDKDLLESQNRSQPSLRGRVPDPIVEIHPDAAKVRGLQDGDWAVIETHNGEARARARHNGALAVDVVVGRHGWWQACTEIGAPGYPADGPGTANYNLLISHDAVDPVSGSVPLRAYLCQVRPLESQA